MRLGSQVKFVLLGATALGTFHAAPALAQAADEERAAPVNGNDIIVTAQRQEQRLQDVPISITVLSAEKLANNNITSAKDIATYTPGLTTNNRYGSDNTTWTIRGFTQEQRTTATVGTYFADVVAPRGSGATQGGDGAGPGNLFDLQNVQVLKGPQGTLFGRNSTGGAVILTPRKPTDRLEGYLEGSVGDYNMWRLQGVVNIPLSDTFKVRLGIDRMKRDGYLKNAGKIGFGPYGDAGGSVDYWAARLSVVGDLTPDLENYTVFSYSNSKSTGIIPKITEAILNDPYLSTHPATSFGPNSVLQMAEEAKLGFWSVSNPLADSMSKSETWQFINTTTWQVSDSIKIKNIFSYAEFRGTTNLDLFGMYQPVNGATFASITNASQLRAFNTTHALPNGETNAESSLVEELQLQGVAADGKFNWQGGLYLEVNNPIGLSGIQSTTQTPCVDNTDPLSCVPGQNAASIGRLAWQGTRNYFRDKAIYWQGSYDLTDQFKITGGIRYTWDTMRSDFQLVNIRVYSATTTSGFNGVPLTIPGINNPIYASGVGFCNNDRARDANGNLLFGTPGTANNPYFPADQRYDKCQESHTVKTSAPTWVLGLDYKPADDILLYAKWSRGYRQGGVASFGADRLQDYRAEKVDTYEIGAKTSWRGGMPGYFNVSAFYNNFRDQQLQIGLQCAPTSACAQTTAIINAGKSRLAGFEVEAGITPFEGFRLEASYAYLNTKLQEIIDVPSYVVALNSSFAPPPVGAGDIRPLPIGSAIPNAMPHKLVLSANYTLPLPESVGKVTIGGTFVYQSKYRVVADPPLLTPATAVAPLVPNTPVQPFTYGSEYGVLPGSKVINLNVNWENVGGMPIDAAFFITNLTNEHVYLHSNVQSGNTGGFISNIIGEPRMFGGRLKYRFGN